MISRWYQTKELTFAEAIAANAKLTSDGWLIVGASLQNGRVEVMAIPLEYTRCKRRDAYEPLDPAVEALLVPFNPEADP